MSQGYEIAIEGLRKHYVRRSGAAVRAIDGISLRVRAGEFIVLLGPSGCGKTTLLRCLAGLETPDAGRIAIGGRTVFDARAGLALAPERRRIGMMFQSYALWPHMTIEQNIAFPLRMRKAPRPLREAQIARVLAMMNIAELAQQYPNQLSGGQQQRVALARAMVCSDELILFDEPLSNVDAKARDRLRVEIGLTQRRLGFTAIYVTHDQEEAMSLADRIVVLGGGRVWQCDAPATVYHQPRNVRVAAFVGAANLLAGRLTRAGQAAAVETPLGTLRPTPDRVRAQGAEVVVVSRPEQWRIEAEPIAGECAWPGTVTLATHLGPHTDYLVRLDARPRRDAQAHSDAQPRPEPPEVQVRDHRPRPFPAGTRVWCAIRPEDLLVLDRDAGDG